MTDALMNDAANHAGLEAADAETSASKMDPADEANSPGKIESAQGAPSPHADDSAGSNSVNEGGHDDAAAPAEDQADEVTGASPGTAQACKDLGLNSLKANLEKLGIKPPGVA